MTVNKRIIGALSGFGNPVVPNVYDGKGDTYYTFNFSTFPINFGDNVPLHERFLVQVHFVCPPEFNYVSRCAKTRRLLHEAGFSWPTMINATTEYRNSGADYQHFVFECELVDGLDADG